MADSEGACPFRFNKDDQECLGIECALWVTICGEPFAKCAFVAIAEMFLIAEADKEIGDNIYPMFKQLIRKRQTDGSL